MTASAAAEGFMSDPRVRRSRSRSLVRRGKTDRDGRNVRDGRDVGRGRGRRRHILFFLYGTDSISDVFCEVSNRFHFIVSFFLHFLVSPLFGELGRAPDKRVQFRFQFFFLEGRSLRFSFRELSRRLTNATQINL